MSKPKQQTIIGLKDLRERLSEYLVAINKGASFTVVRRSKPIFNITPVDDSEALWEPVVDFTKLRKGGVAINDLLSRL
jgi:prevent-host-death family protein